MRPLLPLRRGIVLRWRATVGAGLVFFLLAVFAVAADSTPGDEVWKKPSPLPMVQDAPPAATAPAPTSTPAPASPAPSVLPNTTNSAPARPLPPTQTVPFGERKLLGPPIVVESPQFEVDAPDMASAQRMLKMAEQLPGLMDKFLPWPDQPPSQVQIELVPAAQADFAGPFVVNADHVGHCTALVRWGPDAKFADVCQAIAQASLESLAVWHNGPDAAARAPGWLALALGKLLEAGLKPALIEELSQQGQTLPQTLPEPSLAQLMKSSRPYGDAQPVVAVYAYWLLRLLDEECPNAAQANVLFSALAGGTDPAKALTAAFPDEFDDPRDLELWWQEGLRDFTFKYSTPAQTMAQSRAQLDQLEYLNLPSAEGGEQHTRLDAAWAGRTDKSVRDTIARELVTGRSLPVEANPVYHNAVVSLLTALEMLHGDDEKKFQAAWAQYLADRAGAETTESGVAAALQGTANLDH